MRKLFFLPFFIATPVIAEMPMKVMADLNGNGVPEQFELLVDGENIVTLQITEEGSEPIKAVDIAWKGGLFGQEPGLEVAPNGSVQFISQNEGCCRHRWRQTLTLAYRQDSVRVAGMTYQWRDTLDVEVYGVCDVNYLTGKGVTELGEQDPKWFRVQAVAPKVSEWTLDTEIPDACDVS